MEKPQAHQESIECTKQYTQVTSTYFVHIY